MAYKVNKAASGSTPGNLTVTFKSENGTTIGTGSTSNFSNTVGRGSKVACSAEALPQ